MFCGCAFQPTQLTLLMKRTLPKENVLAAEKPLWRMTISGCTTFLGMVAVAASCFLAERGAAQTTNAFDQASDPAYAGLGAPNGLGAGGQNGGYGFGAWTFTVGGSGGAFVQTSGPSGKSMDMWNMSANAATVAVRPFGSPLTPGQSFSVTLRFNNLNSVNTNCLALEDSSGNLLFSYWHVGGDNLNGWYSDANNARGVATNFAYGYQSFVTYKFTLNSATTYTFTDLETGASFTGNIASVPIVQFAVIRHNGSNSPGDGQDFQFDQFQVTSAAPATFQAVSPGPNALSVATNATLSLSVVSGGIPLNTGSVSLTLDGNVVSPTVTGNSSLVGISYTPSTPFDFATVHAARVVIQDNNSTAYTNAWSFTTGHGLLPVTLAGPFTATATNDLTIMTAAGEKWLGTNYGTNSSLTLYTRYSMVFHDLNGETGSGGGYGGLHFFQDTTPQLMVGNAWISLNWSLDAAGSQQDLTPVTPVVLEMWHTIVIRTDYVPNGVDQVKVWLDPDFSQTEVNQPVPPYQLNADASFNNIHLRSGNGTANATWTNIIVGATSASVGFAVPAAPQFLNVIPAGGGVGVSTNTAIGAQVAVGGNAITAVNLTVDGAPVTSSSNMVSGVISLNYQPAPPLSAGTTHQAQLVVTDSGGTHYTNAWSFTTGFAVLPLVLAGPLGASNADNVIFTAANDAWIGTNYQGVLGQTLYVRFSAEFVYSNSTGVTWGGLEFYQDNTERLLTGKGGASANWSVAAAVPDTDIPPATAFATNQWHTFVVRADYPAGGGNAAVQVWLDPDFSQPEAAQPNGPLQLSINNTFNNIRLRAGFAPASALFSNIMAAATSVGVGFAAPRDAQFQNYVPAQNAANAAVGSPVGVTVVYGSYGIGTNTVAMTLDGTAVYPSFVTTAASLAMTYQPAAPFAAGSSHTVAVSVTDSNGTPYTTSWSFTADAYPTLPVTMAGPVDVTSGLDVTLWTAQNGWLDGNFGANSTNTLYARFSMVFYDFPKTVASSGGSYGGLHFFQDNNERLLVGDAWLSTNWSADAKEAGEPDLLPVTPIVQGEWHTMVVKCVYASNAPTAVAIWLDPDVTKALENQPQAPLTESMNNTFNQIRLRCGNGATYAEFNNIMLAATPDGVGLPVAVLPGWLSIDGRQLSWTGVGTLQTAPALAGPWTDAGNQTNPQTILPTNAAGFYRLRQ